jgi:Cu(I)/Ag(I) efflux system membrane protein CusA/SilA
VGVRVQLPRDLRDDAEVIGGLLVPTMAVADSEIQGGSGHGGSGPGDPMSGIAGTAVPLRWLVDLREVVGPALLRSEGGEATGYVMFNAGGRGEADVMADALASIERWRVLAVRRTGHDPVPAGVRVEPAGRYLQKLEADRRLLWIVPLVLLINLGLLYLAFRRWGLTLAVFAAIPLAFGGGMLGLWIYPLVTGAGPVYLTTAVWVGFIALFGIAVDDGTLMATYLRQEFAATTPTSIDALREAVVRAGLRRIRPCLMTTATTIVSLLPVLWSSGRGSDVMQPMALPLLGGLVASLVTLFTVPALFCWMEERRLAA